MTALPINGIRVGHQMFYLHQAPETLDHGAESLLFQVFADQKINLPCMGLEAAGFGHTLCGCCEQIPEHWDGNATAVCTVSVYPHRSDTRILGVLLSCFARHHLFFYQMVSSNAMISFVIAQDDKQKVLAMLESTFDLPSTHTPYEPGFKEETEAFVKKRYQETRAFFQERRIKTYGFSLKTNLGLTAIDVPFHTLAQASCHIAQLEPQFYFTTALAHADARQMHLYCVTDPGGSEKGSLPPETDTAFSIRQDAVDLVVFQGPHFGDRFGIFNTAAHCLHARGLELILAGCTGACISLVLARGEGDAAIEALAMGFETP